MQLKQRAYITVFWQVHDNSIFKLQQEANAATMIEPRFSAVIANMMQELLFPMSPLPVHVQCIPVWCDSLSFMEQRTVGISSLGRAADGVAMGHLHLNNLSRYLSRERSNGFVRTR